MILVLLVMTAAAKTALFQAIVAALLFARRAGIQAGRAELFLADAALVEAAATKALVAAGASDGTFSAERGVTSMTTVAVVRVNVAATIVARDIAPVV